MNLTTKDIIKLLPFTKDLKDRLLADFDSLDANRKFMVEDAVWNTYCTIYKLKLQKNLNLALIRASNNQEKLDANFYQRVEAATEEEMKQENMSAIQDADLSAARKAMETIVKEIQLSKRTK